MKRVIMLLIFVFVLSSITACGDSNENVQRRRGVAEESESKNTEENDKQAKFQGKDADEEVKMVKLPDVSGTDLDSAKAVLINKGFLITIEEQYSDTIRAGDVVDTNPKSGTMLEENSKVILIISKGPSMIECKDATIEWYNIDSNAPDDWNFSTPTIYNGNLYFWCDVTFGVDFTFKGRGFGNASITDTFDKQAPISLLDEKLGSFPEGKQVKQGQKESFVICVPLAQLDSERPTHVACELVILVGEKEKQIKVSFNISW